MTPELMTHTRQRTFRDCQRKHQLRYELGVVPAREHEALRFGSLIDGALSAWDRTNGDLDAALAFLRSAQADPFDLAKAEALVRGYHVRWEAADVEVIASQPSFNLPLLNPNTARRSLIWRLAGKLDALVRYQGRVWPLERKTTSEDISPGSHYWTRLRLDAQVSIYVDAARALGHPEVDGCLYDVIGKPELRPLQVNKRRSVAETPEEYRNRILENIAENPDSYFGRAPVVRLEREISAARWDVWHVARQIREVQKSGYAPRNPEACSRLRGSVCSYFDACSGQASLDDRERFRVVENVHPELTT